MTDIPLFYKAESSFKKAGVVRLVGQKLACPSEIYSQISFKEKVHGSQEI